MAVPGRSEESAGVANLFVESVHIPRIMKICTIELASDRICMNPHNSKKRRLRIRRNMKSRIRIHIKVKSLIRIRIRVKIREMRRLAMEPWRLRLVPGSVCRPKVAELGSASN
jgi:hypothetical protein